MSSATDPGPTGPEQAAVRKVIYQTAGLDGMDTGDMGIVEAANQALENIEDMAARIDDLEDKVDALNDRAPDPKRKAYADLSREDKVTVVCSKLRAEAGAPTGAAAAEYKDILRMFDGEPSAGHAYQLMDAATNRDGFQVGKNAGGTKRLTYNATRVNDSA